MIDFLSQHTVSWNEVDVYGIGAKGRHIFKYKAWTPQAERIVAYSILPDDFIGMEELWEHKDFVMKLSRCFSAYEKAGEGESFPFRKLKIAFPEFISKAIRNSVRYKGKGGSPLKTGDHTEEYSIYYGNLPVVQIAGKLYYFKRKDRKGLRLHVDCGAPEWIPCFTASTVEPLCGKLSIAYKKISVLTGRPISNTYYIGTLDLETGKLDEIMPDSNLRDKKRITLLNDRTAFIYSANLLGPDCLYSIVDLEEKKVLDEGYYQDSTPNFIIHQGRIWVEHFEAAIQLYPIPSPEPKACLQISYGDDGDLQEIELTEDFIPLRLTNTSDQVLRVLSPWDVDDSYFFSYQIMKHGKPVEKTDWKFVERTHTILPHWGSVDHFLGDIDDDSYVELLPGESFKFDVELSTKSYITASDDEYLIMCYVNTLGNDCVKGVFVGPAIKIYYRD